MRKSLLKMGLLCLVTIVSAVAKAQSESNIQEKELYSSDFTEWSSLDASAKETVAQTATTKYSHEEIAFTVYNTNVAPDPNDIGIDWNKFDDSMVGGTLQAEKNGGSYITTSALASVTKVTFVHGATGGNRGWSLWAKGDGDVDWVQLTTKTADPAGWSEVTATVNRTNCQLKFTNLADAQNAYMFRLNIYGNVDMSLTPALGSFTFNDSTYQAPDIFEEVAENVQEATIELWNGSMMPAENFPVRDIVCDNGEVDGDVIYTPQEDGSVVVTIKVTANSETVTYNIHFKYKPFFTLSYYDTDGQYLIGTQLVEKDMPITESLLLAISLAVAAIPEGLPAVITVILSLGLEATSL